MSEKFNTRISMSLYFMKGSKRYFLCSILFAMGASLLDLLNPKIVGIAIDLLSGLSMKEIMREFPTVVQGLFLQLDNAGSLFTELTRLAVLVAIIALLGAVFRYLYKLFNAMGAERLVERMRNSIFTHIEKLKYSWYMENSTGDIIQRCTSDVETVKNFLSEQLTSVFRIVVMIGIALSFMFSIHRGLALVAAVFVPIVFTYSLLFHGKIGESFLEADEEEGKLSSIAQENLTGVRVVRAFGREVEERKKFEKQNDIYTGAYMRFSVLISIFWSLGEFISGFQVMLVVIIGAYLAVQGRLSAGDYVAFISYNSMLVWPVRSLGRVVSDMSKAGVSVDRIRYIMNSEEEKDREDAVEAKMDEDIRFEHVSFRYSEDSPEILKDVSFRIPKGKTFGILGGTGSGKSTLMLLLERLYELPEGEGRILIGDQDIRNIKGEWLRRNIGMVLQEPYLFSRTLGENIAIAKQGASHADIVRAAKTASLSDAVAHFKTGYETMVGERGVTLSGGQKQRTAIAQMVIRETPIMIFDDSLSAVDAETDARIRGELKKAAGDATIILISHRITTLQQADEILVLNRGEIAEQGSHDELIKKNGIYKKICDIQSIGTEQGDAINSEGTEFENSIDFGETKQKNIPNARGNGDGKSAGNEQEVQ